MLVQSRVRAASREWNADVRLDCNRRLAASLRADRARAMAFPAVQSAAVARAARGDCTRCHHSTEIEARSIRVAKCFPPRHGRRVGNGFGNCGLWRRLIDRPTAATAPSSAGQCDRHGAGKFAIAECDRGDRKPSGEVNECPAQRSARFAPSGTSDNLSWTRAPRFVPYRTGYARNIGLPAMFR